MRNIKITLEYDGTNYSGWQIQKNTSRTIQQILEKSLTELNKSSVRVIGAGRTDAGVHALGQVASFGLDVSIPVKKIPFALNSLLPEDIICKAAEEVDQEFHARFSAKGKKYRYRILNAPFSSVFERNYVYHLRSPLDLNKMVKAAEDLTGEHDFAAFKASSYRMENTVRRITGLKLIRWRKEIWIECTGDAFLYNMVRIISGTLLEIGLGKRSPEIITELLKSKDRKLAGFTAPAKGLTLIEVDY